LELERLPIGDRSEVWESALNAAMLNETPLTASIVKKAVNTATTKPRKRKEKPRKEKPPADSLAGLDVDDDEDEAEAEEKPSTIKLTEAGEKALDRIRRLCGKSYADALENGTVKISEKNIIKWAEQDENMVPLLGHYVVDQRWSVDHALKFEEEMFNGDTTVDRLVDLQNARGG
jgi:hypothetical protein